MGLMLGVNEFRDLCQRMGGSLGLPQRQQLKEAAEAFPL